MKNDLITDLQNQREPEQEDCSSGIVPINNETTVSPVDEQEVLVPVLTSMRKFLFQNYRLTLYSYLNRSLRNGTLESIIGFRVVNKVIDRHVCSFGNPTFWRVGRETFVANVGVTLCLDTGKESRSWEGFLSLWFHMGEKVTCSVEYLGAMDELADEELPMLSSYLVPIFSNRQMDTEAEAIWARYLPEAICDPEKRSAVALAKKMGLTIQYQPVYRHKDTASILFFEEGELMVKDEMAENASETKPISVTIPADTIVINTNAVQQRYAGFQIYHECVHFEEHYLFYRLQKMGNNDPHTIKTEKVKVREGVKINDPVYWMEKQANRGAYGLLMPATATQDIIQTELQNTTKCPHIGYRYQVVGEEIANRFELPWFRVRARMIQLGHVGARGALHCADHHRIEPFAFDHNSWEKDEQTFVIDKDSAWKLYEKDDNFRKLIDSGLYTYADGHIVRSGRAFCREGVQGSRLSTWANAHVDQCCVRFVRRYEQQHVGKYVFGRMNYDEAYVKQTCFYLESDVDQLSVKELVATKRFRESFPDTFKEGFQLLRKRNKLSLEKVAELMHVSDTTLRRWLDAPEEKLTIDFVVTVALAMHLPDWLSALLLDRAHKCLSDSNKRHLALKWILRVMWNDGIQQANDFLKKLGFDPLMV